MTSPTDQRPPSEAGSGVRGQARGFVDDVKQGAEAMAETGKAEGAKRLEGVSGLADRVADEVAEQSPEIADYVRRAARGLESASRELKDRKVSDLLDSVSGFARREPAAFLAASAVAGFALSRLLKSSASGSPGWPLPAVGSEASAASGGGAAPVAGWAPPDVPGVVQPDEPPRPKTDPIRPASAHQAGFASSPDKTT